MQLACEALRQIPACFTSGGQDLQLKRAGRRRACHPVLAVHRRDPVILLQDHNFSDLAPVKIKMR